MQINIKVTEVLSRNIKVDATSINEAIDIVENMYKKEEIVLDYTDFNNVLIEKKEENFNSKKDLLINKVIQYLIKDEEKHYEELQKPNNHIYLTLLELQKYI
ncbi:MAG: hypothetical protein KU38_11885 [Sulfurovum sp. FS08-3]|nr:MAG: hypothetical protein KU38_11885 [Sulfurovum sp. FS08-3]